MREVGRRQLDPACLRNEPNVRAPGGTKKWDAASATRRKRCGGPVAHRQRIFPFCVWIARSSLWDTDPP